MQEIALRAVLGSCLCGAAALAAVAGLPTGKDAIERLKADVYYLASDTLEGRGVSTPGIGLAAQHIRAEFKRLGLKSGAPDGSYFQAFRLGGNSKSGREQTLHNVIGVIEGNGELASQTIVIGAHYDHLGYGQFGSLAPAALRGRIHSGADDNASGTAAMLELARRFAARGTPPRRRMVFMAFLRRGGRPDRQPSLCVQGAHLPDQGHRGDDEFRHGGPSPRRRIGGRRERVRQRI